VITLLAVRTWQLIDPASGYPYYYNPSLDQTQWETPRGAAAAATSGQYQGDAAGSYQSGAVGPWSHSEAHQTYASGQTVYAPPGSDYETAYGATSYYTGEYATDQDWRAYSAANQQPEDYGAAGALVPYEGAYESTMEGQGGWEGQAGEETHYEGADPRAAVTPSPWDGGPLADPGNPSKWETLHDADSGMPFFRNKETSETTWEVPEGLQFSSIPPIKPQEPPGTAADRQPDAHRMAHPPRPSCPRCRG
jgi:hypothetical protein